MNRPLVDFFPQTESLFTGYFREYAPGLGMVLYLHVNASFYPPIHCGTKSFFILLGPVPERPISVNPGLKFCSVFVFYIPMHCLG